MINEDKNAILALMPYRSQDSKNQERGSLDLKKIPVMDLLNGVQFNLNMVNPKGDVFDD